MKRLLKLMKFSCEGGEKNNFSHSVRLSWNCGSLTSPSLLKNRFFGKKHTEDGVS